MNTGAPQPRSKEADARVLHLQRKLHKWATTDGQKRFCDLWNLVCDPATLQVAWKRVSSNKGSRTSGVDAITRYHVEHRYGVDRFLSEIRQELRDRSFRPLPVRERGIPKKGGKFRYLGIPTLKDRVVQMALKLVLDHRALMAEVGRRIGDRRVLALIRVFLKAGVMTEAGHLERRLTGTPQGGIISPLLANVALSVLDREFDRRWEEWSRYPGLRQYIRRKGLATYRLVRFADDFVIVVKRHPGASRGRDGRTAGNPRTYRAATLCRQDTTGPHRRWLWVPRPSNCAKASSEQEAMRLYLRVGRVVGLGQTQGEGSHEGEHQEPFPAPVAPHAQLHFAGLGGVLSLRRRQAHVLLLGALRLVAGRPVAPKEAQRPDMEMAMAPLPVARAAAGEGDGALQPGSDANRSLPLSRQQDSDALERCRCECVWPPPDDF